jgi:hypothetical protein
MHFFLLFGKKLLLGKTGKKQKITQSPKAFWQFHLFVILMKTRKTHLIFAYPDQMTDDFPVWTDDVSLVS